MPLAVVILAAVLIMGLILFLRFQWNYKHILAVAKKLSCPPVLPILGNGLLLMGGVRTIRKVIIDLTNQFKDVFCLWVGLVPVFVVSNPADVQIVLNSSSTLEKDDVYDFLRQHLGNGLLTSPVPIWKKYRRIIAPLVHPSSVEKYLEVFNNVSRQLAQRFLNNPAMDPRYDIFHASVDAAMLTVMGRKVTLDEEHKTLVHHLLEEMGGVFLNRLTNIWLHIDWLFQLLYSEQLDRAVKGMRSLKEVYLEHFKENWDEKRSKEMITGEKCKPENNFCYLLYTMPEEQAENHTWWDEVSTMLVGATDTTVSSLSFLLLSIAMYPDIQTKIREEINDVIGDSNRDVTAKDIESLTYLEQVLMESMRLHGVFPVILRKAVKDTKLTTTTLPAGSRIVIPLHAMGWNEDIFPEPHKFLPERFSPENSSTRHKYSFLPFSGGPRNCLGKKYAISLLKTVVVHTLQKFEVRTRLKMEDIEYEIKVIMFSKTPVELEFVRI